MNPHDFAVLVAVGALALSAMLAAAGLVDVLGPRWLADKLGLDLGPEDEQ